MGDKYNAPPPAYPQASHQPGNYPPQGGAAQEFYSGQPQQSQYPPQQGYYPPQQGYPQQQMHYGPPGGQPPAQGYYADDRGKAGGMGSGICAGILGAMACCCCLDILF
ncbi:hypothetical protein LOZ58_001144 [Ophidiomyces ophidiicola]|nr:hypothetical protein LOZ65_001067 [Ophidiomyces ophidiicola]KAI1937237.1 hypothetical protein LOZ66_004155 [Ophidiomyces ophidiicola]KAI1965298.1 hypothetical protein LOZ58_001144 [Ophidiomyces ophidiicola]